MALGRRGAREQTMWVATTTLPRSAGHPFYTRLNALLAEAEFDRFVEAACAPITLTTHSRVPAPDGRAVSARCERSTLPLRCGVRGLT